MLTLARHARNGIEHPLEKAWLARMLATATVPAQKGRSRTNSSLHNVKIVVFGIISVSIEEHLKTIEIQKH